MTKEEVKKFINPPLFFPIQNTPSIVLLYAELNKIPIVSAPLNDIGNQF